MGLVASSAVPEPASPGGPFSANHASTLCVCHEIAVIEGVSGVDDGGLQKASPNWLLWRMTCQASRMPAGWCAVEMPKVTGKMIGG